MEASSHGLDQHRLDGVQVTAAAFTNLSQRPSRLSRRHGEPISTAKLRLFADLLPPGGTAVLNADSWPQAPRLIETARQRAASA